MRELTVLRVVLPCAAHPQRDPAESLPSSRSLGCAADERLCCAQLMSVEGLTRENVASHLQKYRLQLKKDHRLDEDGNLAEAQVCPCFHTRAA